METQEEREDTCFSLVLTLEPETPALHEARWAKVSMLGFLRSPQTLPANSSFYSRRFWKQMSKTDIVSVIREWWGKDTWKTVIAKVGQNRREKKKKAKRALETQEKMKLRCLGRREYLKPLPEKTGGPLWEMKLSVTWRFTKDSEAEGNSILWNWFLRSQLEIVCSESLQVWKGLYFYSHTWVTIWL